MEPGCQEKHQGLAARCMPNPHPCTPSLWPDARPRLQHGRVFAWRAGPGRTSAPAAERCVLAAPSPSCCPCSARAPGARANLEVFALALGFSSSSASSSSSKLSRLGLLAALATSLGGGAAGGGGGPASASSSSTASAADFCRNLRCLNAIRRVCLSRSWLPCPVSTQPCPLQRRTCHPRGDALMQIYSVVAFNCKAQVGRMKYTGSHHPSMHCLSGPTEARARSVPRHFPSVCKAHLTHVLHKCHPPCPPLTSMGRSGLTCNAIGLLVYCACLLQAARLSPAARASAKPHITTAGETGSK